MNIIKAFLYSLLIIGGLFIVTLLSYILIPLLIFAIVFYVVYAVISDPH